MWGGLGISYIKKWHEGKTRDYKKKGVCVCLIYKQELSFGMKERGTGVIKV
jgi:hypothetical protein